MKITNKQKHTVFQNGGNVVKLTDCWRVALQCEIIRVCNSQIEWVLLHVFDNKTIRSLFTAFAEYQQIRNISGYIGVNLYI